MRAALAALVLALGAPAAAWAQMYKCVDARGVTHYADKPTPGCANSAVDIRGSPPISGRLAAPGEGTAQQEADFRRRQSDREQAEQAEGAARAELERQCAQLRREHAVLASGRRLARIDAQGERIFMDDAERERRLADVQAALRRCP